MNDSKNYFAQQKRLVDDLEQRFLASRHRPTIVDMQKDYANNQQICLTSVVFIPDDVANVVTEQVIKPLRAIEPGHYFYTDSSLHLTIKNIRTIHNPPLFSEADMNKVDKLFQRLVPEFPEFEFNVEDVLLFPTSISVMAYAGVEFQKLVLALDEGLRNIGVPDNKQYLSNSIFWGNITVCRFTDQPSHELMEAVKRIRKLKIGRMKVQEIHVLTCNSVCHPSSRKIIGKYHLKRRRGIS